ncbi:MAG: 3' terminal RNA ribose 2'-O-methyltransferase Hen1 [Treponema sp.]|nr:3' terminal RNA ribose 2'-O-methyltransferase Hen1 [Treponema sp.]MCL2252461.1 3' terminal RNA ribose 2'-O-methyltransferase Hen1 [Treponema sp.]
MLLTITCTGENASAISFLLYKNPYRPQKFELGYGSAYVFYPELSDKKTAAALLLDINPVNLARGKEGSSNFVCAPSGLFDYVNDRPYVSSSFMSVAISSVFRTAMSGRADEYQQLSDSLLNLEAVITMLPCRSDTAMLNRVFEPLGYEVKIDSFNSDDNFPDWGESKYVNLTIKGNVRLRDLLKHIYILIPVFDKQKHYWIGKDEVDKLLRNAGDWLTNHPEKTFITSRYLKRLNPLVNQAFEQLVACDTQKEDNQEEDKTPQEIKEKRLTLNAQRLGSVVAALKNCNARSVIDIGCGEGNLLRFLVREKQFENIAGADVSFLALERAAEKLKLSETEYLKEKVNLFQSSLTYKDARFKGYDAVCIIEVIEHLDLSRLNAFERVLFEFTKPRFIILTTPNREYNVKYEYISEGKFRHNDHRFEWTREEFRSWAEKVSLKYGYTVKFSEIGEKDEVLGASTQMGVFTLCA